MAIFQVGKAYEFNILEQREGAYRKVTINDTVVEVEGSVLRLSSGAIFNVQAATFEGAIDKAARQQFDARASRSQPSRSR